MEGSVGGREVGDWAKSCNPLLLSNTETFCLEDEVILIFGFCKLRLGRFRLEVAYTKVSTVNH